MSVPNFLQTTLDNMVADFKSANLSTWVDRADYVLKCTDELINVVEPVLQAGSDKKTAVLAGLTYLLANVVSPNLPLWLVPFTSSINTIVLTIIAPIVINFIVSKYNSGSWGNSVVNPVPMPAPETTPPVAHVADGVTVPPAGKVCCSKTKKCNDQH